MQMITGAVLTTGTCHSPKCFLLGYGLLLMFFLDVLVHGQVTIIFVESVCLFVCLFVCAEFFSAIFDPLSIKLGHMLYVWV